MEPDFRKTDVTVKDRVITLQQQPIEKIFVFSTQPYIVVGLSGCGKTTLCLDILHKFSKEATNIYYITSTKETIKDDTISQIPRAFRRKPTFENINAIWQEIIEQHDASEANETELIKLYLTLTNDNQTIDQLQNKRESIYKTQLESYLLKNDPNAESKAKNDGRALFIDCVTKLIIDAANKNGTSQLSHHEMVILRSLISPQPKVILLMDDISSELNTLRTSQTKVLYKNVPTRVGEAYKSVLMDILTRGRHYGALICMFLHTIDLIPDKSLINNIIILNKEASKKIRNAKSFPDEMREILDAVTPVLFDGNYKYCFLSISQTNDTVCVGKASLHNNEEIPLSEMNKRYVQLVDKIYSGYDVADFVSSSDHEFDTFTL